MKRLVACLAAGCLLLAGCTAPAAPHSEAIAPRAPDELVYWSTWEEDSPQAEAIRQLAGEYQRDTGIAVQIRWNGPDNPDLVRRALEQGETVDLFDGDCTAVSSRFARLLADLDQPAAEAGYDGFAVSALPQTVRQNAGGLVCIPYQIQMSGILYSREAFAQAGITKPPSSWEEFSEACAKLKVCGYCPMAVPEESAACLAGYQIGRALNIGAESPFAQTHSAGEPDLLQALEALEQLRREGMLCAGQPPENAAMLPGTTAALAEKNAQGQDWGIFCYPTLPQSTQPATTAALQACALAVPQASRWQKEAFAFIMRLASGEGNERLAACAGAIPADTRSAWPPALEPAQSAFSSLTSVFVPDTALIDYLRGWAGPTVYSMLCGQQTPRQTLCLLREQPPLKTKMEESS